MRSDLRCTYRLQLHAGFGFDDAAAVADYLATLGISHLYSSPYLQAAPGSTHGYDVVDHHRVNVELGGPDAHRRFCEALGRHDLGQVLDVVPNHMAISGPENKWWWDVLENGPSSLYAGYFDVEWDLPEERLRNKVLLPVLGDHYGRVLEAGELRLAHEDGRFTIHYYEHEFPVSPRSLDELLRTAATWCRSDVLAFIADHLGELPLPTVNDVARAERRHRDKEVLRAWLARLCIEEPAVLAAVDAAVSRVNADSDALDHLLDRQNYRLAYWRAGERDLSYRRFFDIDTLVGLRADREPVFRDTHARVLSWLDEGVLDGLRVDHPDGLRDPHEYFHRLREAAPDGWIIAEKILQPGEHLRDVWPIDGTTGYDFANRVGGLFVDPAGEAPMTALYAELTGESTDFGALIADKKEQVLRELLGSDLTRLTHQFVAVCERHRRHRDYTRNELRACLRAVVACFPVYRTYVRAEAGVVTEEDVRCVDEAVRAAKERAPEIDPGLFDFLHDLLLLRVPGPAEAELVMRLQQLTGAAAAKGVEDTAFYVYNRLIALNEVGGDPGRFGVSVEAFHRETEEIRRRWPTTMLGTSTHDTKRSEDVRARLYLLSEIPDRWGEAARRWMAHNERHRRNAMPDRNTEYYLYQTAVGAWPIGPDRLVPHMEKATREAKVHTSWIDPEPDFDEAVQAFTEAILADSDFTNDLDAFVRPLVGPGRVNSLAQTLVKLTAPGVPDLYQGTELWDLSLVDPDNRRPVDFERRRRLLAELPDLTPEDVMARADEGLPKLWVIRRALALRKQRPAAFGPAGSHRPLRARGERAAHVVAFARGDREDRVVTVVPRLVLGLGGDWRDTELELPTGRWRNVLTGDRVDRSPARLADLLSRFPVALLAKEDER